MLWKSKGGVAHGRERVGGGLRKLAKKGQTERIKETEGLFSISFPQVGSLLEQGL